VPIASLNIEAAVLRGNGPYTARSASDRTDDWPFWYVTNDGRTNVLYFPGGAVLTSRAVAEQIAIKFNQAASPPEGET
jgi:hypothetical protein